MIKSLAVIIISVLVFPLLPITYTVDLKGELHDKAPAGLDWALFLADDNDTIKININSVGGDALTMFELIARIEASPAKTIAINNAFAMSAAANIAMATDERQSIGLSVYMFHRGRSGGELLDENHIAEIFSNYFMERKVFPHMTEDQIKAYKEGKDVFILAEALNHERD